MGCCSVGFESPSQVSSDSVLSLHSLSASQRGVCVLKDIDLSLAAGQLMALLGPNGAGKSTLLHCASGLGECSRGQVFLSGEDIHGLSSLQRARRVAVLPQQSALNFPFRVAEVVALGRHPQALGGAQDRATTAAIMRCLEIEDLAQRLYTELSGGERQRVQLARVINQLLVSPQLDIFPDSVLLLDEPVAALDLPHQTQLMELLRQLCQRGLSVLVVLHDINLAAAYADSVALLKQGRLLACDRPDKVITAPLIKAVYGVDVTVVEHPHSSLPLVIR